MSPCCVASMLPRLTVVLNDMGPNLPVREFARELLAPDATAGAPEPAIPFVQVQMPESAAAASEPPASAPAAPASPDDPAPASAGLAPLVRVLSGSEATYRRSLAEAARQAAASAPEDHRPPSYDSAWSPPSIAVGDPGPLTPNDPMTVIGTPPAAGPAPAATASPDDPAERIVDDGSGVLSQIGLRSRGADTPLSSPEPEESQDVLDVIASALQPLPAGPPPFRPIVGPHAPAARRKIRTASQLGIHLPTQVAQPPPADPVSDAHSSPPVAMQNPPSLERVGPGPAPMDCDTRDALNPHGFTVVPPSSQDEPPPTPCPEDAIITSSQDDDEPDEPAAKKSRMREE